jgi:hypothetical protein
LLLAGDRSPRQSSTTAWTPRSEASTTPTAANGYPTITTSPRQRELRHAQRCGGETQWVDRSTTRCNGDTSPGLNTRAGVQEPRIQPRMQRQIGCPRTRIAWLRSISTALALKRIRWHRQRRCRRALGEPVDARHSYVFKAHVLSMCSCLPRNMCSTGYE